MQSLTGVQLVHSCGQLQLRSCRADTSEIKQQVTSGLDGIIRDFTEVISVSME